MEVLRSMAPLALVQCLIMSVVNGEIRDMLGNVGVRNPRVWAVVGVGSLMAFTLNLSSLAANKATSPVTLCVAANVKQAVMVLASERIFGDGGFGGWRMAGVWTAIGGGGIYSWVTVREQMALRGKGKKGA